MEENRKGSITTVYDYEPVVLINEFDPLQRFRHVKIEATSFTVSEPFTELEIEPVIYTFANEAQRRIMHENYGLLPFKIQTIKLERIFVDKIFAAEFYCNRGLYFDVAKHVYDVAVMLDLPSIKNLTSDLVELLRMIEYKRMEVTRRIGSDLAHKSFTDFRIFHCLADNSTFDEELEKM